MKNVSAFLKRHSALLLLVLVLATVPAGIAFGKYVKSVKVTDSLNLTVSMDTGVRLINGNSFQKKLNTIYQNYAGKNELNIIFGKYDDYSQAVSGFRADNVAVDKNGKITDAYKIYYKSGSSDVYILSDQTIYANESCYYMFYGCRENYSSSPYYPKIANIRFENFDTSYVTDMRFMFCLGGSITSLDLSGWNVSNVKTMENMFANSTNLTEVNLSGWDVSNVTNMEAMFMQSGKLKKIYVTEFDTSSAETMRAMFGRCYSLTELDVSGFDTSNVTDMFNMFSSCWSLTELDVSGFDTSNVTTMYGMFSGCRGLSKLDVTKFDTSNVTNMVKMFSSCSGLTSLDVSNFNTSKVTDMSSMFSYCSGLTSLDISSFDTSNVIKMSEMFYKCSNLATINASDKFKTDKVTSGSDMFTDCKSLVGGAGTVYSASHVDKIYARIDGGSNSTTPGYFTGNLTTNSVTGSSEALNIRIES